MTQVHWSSSPNSTMSFRTAGSTLQEQGHAGSVMKRTRIGTDRAK
jgi:hypothetical protein